MATRKTPGVYPCGEKVDPNDKVVDVYFYPKADGTPYGMVKRTESKRFPQFYWKQTTAIRDTNDDRNWAKGEPKPKIPYNLPSIDSASEDTTLYICEGEKDANTLIDLGLLATTCTSAGGGRGWSDDIGWKLSHFENIVLNEDDDPGGHAFVKTVIKSLKRCGHRGTIKIVHYLGVNENGGGDVSDWIGDVRTMNNAQLKERREAYLQYVEETGIVWNRPVLPTVTLNSDLSFAEVVDATEDHLVITQPQHNVMFRGGTLVRPIWEKTKNDRGGENNMFKFQRLTPIALSDVVTKYACIYGKLKGKDQHFEPCEPPTNVMDALLQRPYTNLPRAAGILNTPAIDENGRIIDKEGFDEETGFYLGPMGYNFHMEPIPEHVTKEMAEEALRILREVFGEFKFVTDLDFAVAMSALLTLVCRPAIPNVPLTLFVAPAAGSGKSYLVDCITMIATGETCPLITFTGDDREDEKRLGTQLLEGAHVFSLDNMSKNFSHDLLCQMTVSTNLRIRVLGQSSMPRCRNNSTVFATGNNIAPTGDMVRRTTICSLDTKSPDPEKVGYKGDPMKLINEDRARYVRACLIIVKAYMQAKDKVKLHPVASFERWSALIREALVWLGLPDVWQSVDEAKERDAAISFEHQLVPLWVKGDVLEVGKPYTTKAIIKKVTDRYGSGAASMNVQEEEDNLFDLFTMYCGDGRNIDPKKLGQRLRAAKNRNVNGYCLSTIQDYKHGNKWFIERMGRTFNAGDDFGPNVEAEAPF